MIGHEIRAPFHLMYGRPESEHIESYPSFVGKLQENLSVIREFAKKNIELNYERMEKNYNIHNTRRAFVEGDLVWFYNPRQEKRRSPKVTGPWEGPYIVLKKLNDLVCRILLNYRSKPKVVHQNRLWKYAGVRRMYHGHLWGQ